MNNSLFSNIFRYGIYYNPASTHYAEHNRNLTTFGPYQEFNSKPVNVVCDRCSKSNLKVCIGWNDSDLCMKCVDEISNLCNNDDYYNNDKYVPIPARSPSRACVKEYPPSTYSQ